MRYKKSSKNSDYYFNLNSAELNDDLFFIAANKIENICFTDSDGYSENDISPIENMGWIKKLRIFVNNIDLRKVTSIKSLNEFYVGKPYTFLDLTGLEKLRLLYLTESGPVYGLDTLQKLEDLTIVNGSPKLLTDKIFQHLISLTQFRILNVKKNVNSFFMSSLRTIKKLDIAYFRGSLNTTHFLGFSSELEKLEIEKCKNVEHLEENLPKFSSLKYLSLIDSVTLTNTTCIEKMKNLEVLVILGKSYFINGEIQNLKSRLNHVSIDDKKHYTLKNEDMPKLPYES